MDCSVLMVLMPLPFDSQNKIDKNIGTQRNYKNAARNGHQLVDRLQTGKTLRFKESR